MVKRRIVAAAGAGWQAAAGRPSRQNVPDREHSGFAGLLPKPASDASRAREEDLPTKPALSTV